MGKIESGEIGEVDPLPDSGNSPALIRYARRAASSHSPQHAERGGSLREEDRGKLSAHLSVQRLPLGTPKVFQETLLCFPHLFVFAAESGRKAMPSGSCMSRARAEFQKSCNCFWLRGAIGEEQCRSWGSEAARGRWGDGGWCRAACELHGVARAGCWWERFARIKLWARVLQTPRGGDVGW